MKIAIEPKLPSFVKKLHWKEILALLFILLGVYFFNQEHRELKALAPALRQAGKSWLLAGAAVTVVYFFLQGLMYFYCFRAVGARVNIWRATELFLKRNFISVFLPAGGISSLSYQPKSLRHTVTHQKHIHQASGIYAFVGILTVFLIGVPVLFIAGANGNLMQTGIRGLVVLVLLLATVFYLFRSFRNKGRLYNRIVKLFPSWQEKMEEMFSFNITWAHFLLAILVSLIIEISGIIHLYIAMGASGSQLSIGASSVGYVVAVIFLVISPFLMRWRLQYSSEYSNSGFHFLRALQPS